MIRCMMDLKLCCKIRRSLWMRLIGWKKKLTLTLKNNEEVLGQKVKVEVENALLVIMDKKYKAEQEILELK